MGSHLCVLHSSKLRGLIFVNGLQSIWQVEAADWLPPSMTSMGSPVWQAAQQPPPLSPPALVPKAPASPSHADSHSPSPPQPRLEGAQPKVPSPTLLPAKQPVQSDCPGAAHRGHESIRHTISNLPQRAVQPPADQRCMARRGTEIPRRSSPRASPKGSPVTAVRGSESPSPPPLRVPAQPVPFESHGFGSPRNHVQSPKDTCEGQRGRRPSFGPFHAPPGGGSPNEMRQNQDVTLSDATCLNGYLPAHMSQA